MDYSIQGNVKLSLTVQSTMSIGYLTSGKLKSDLLFHATETKITILIHETYLLEMQSL